MMSLDPAASYEVVAVSRRTWKGYYGSVLDPMDDGISRAGVLRSHGGKLDAERVTAGAGFVAAELRHRRRLSPAARDVSRRG